jgi:hypothetical protein
MLWLLLHRHTEGKVIFVRPVVQAQDRRVRHAAQMKARQPGLYGLRQRGFAGPVKATAAAAKKQIQYLLFG